MKSRSSFLAGHTLGVVCGSVAILLLDLKTRPQFREILRTNFLVEQARKAALASTSDDTLRTAAHRWCAAEVADPNPGSVFTPGYQADIDAGLFLPFGLLILEQVGKPSRVTGPLVEESLARAKLALALEGLGQQPSADEQWHIVERLVPERSNAELRRIASETAEQERKLYAQAAQNP